MNFSGFRLKNIFKALLEGDKHERIKVALLSVCFFVVIGGYTLVKELKDSVFLNVVGLEYLPWVKLFSMIVLIPLVFFYSKLVDVLRRYHLLYFYAIVYGLGGMIFAYFLGHPTIGLANTDASPNRVFGWVFYFFVEGYSPFLVSVLWAFVNSITKPEAVKDSYIILTASAKLGGAMMAGFAWWLLHMNACGNSCFSDVVSHQILLVLASLILLCVPFVIAYMMHKVPGYHMHGYEAAYKAEKQRSKAEENVTGVWNSLKSMFSGLYLIISYPYVLGIFGMIFFWEIINVIFNYLRLGIGQAATESVSGFGVFLYQQACFTHLVGFVFVLLGTKTIITWLGERRSLIAIPVMIGGIITYYLVMQTLAAATLAYVLMRAVNYAFAYPLRESLYIPTTKAMKFKSKSWIDGFGSKLSKGVGSYYNIFIQGIAKASIVSVHMLFFGLVIFLWGIMANLLGRRFEAAVKKNEVIGTDDQ
jgi:AAA family ATP:ADP antiporter